MQVEDFHYELPPELIARYPLPERTASRLLCLDGLTGKILPREFKQLPDLLLPGDLLVFNNTRVIPARLFGSKETGGKVEVLVEKILGDQRALVKLRTSKSPKLGLRLFFGGNFCAEVVGRNDDHFELEFAGGSSIQEILNKIGHIPLPPYFKRQAEDADFHRYQTVFAQHEGAVAAPTAGLHFDQEMLDNLSGRGIGIGFLTLHVGSGTYQPVRSTLIKDHIMHKEHLQVSEQLCEQIRVTKQNGGRIIAVGTTSARALETATHAGEVRPYNGDTQIFIYPGFKFNCIDALVTNFHLPGSTLLMLVAALAGFEHILAAYKEAIKLKYRFFSYGDAMFITRKE